jgi:hypothetical protein
VVAVAVLGLAGCGKADAGKPSAAPAASAGSVLRPVPERETPQAEPATPRSPGAGRASKPERERAKPAKTAADEGGAGSGNSGLDAFVAAVQRELPDVALDRRDEEVEDLGQEACQGLAAGKKDAVVAGEISAEGVAPPDARKLVTLARTTACGGRPKV